MKFTDYKHVMIVSSGTALFMQNNPRFTSSILEPVEDVPYSNAKLHMCGTLIYDVLKTDEYPDGKMYVAVYLDSSLPFVNQNGK